METDMKNGICGKIIISGIFSTSQNVQKNTQNPIIVDYEIKLGISEEENYEKLINSYPEDMNLPGRFLKSGNSSESDFLPNLSSDKNNHL